MADDSKNLLDMMLEDSQHTPGKTESDQNEKRRELAREPAEEPVEEPSWPDDVEQLAQLSSKDLSAWLAEVKPGDLLCVVAEGSEGLRQRIMGQLDGESVTWLRQNLQLWDPPTDRLKNDARAAVVEIARELLAAGRITRPESSERLGQDQDTEEEGTRDQLTETLVQLVAVAHDQGVDALVEVIGDIDHPMLAYGLRVALDHPSPTLLERRLDERKEALEAALRAELELIRQAILAIGRGDDHEIFLERVRRK